MVSFLSLSSFSISSRIDWSLLYIWKVGHRLPMLISVRGLEYLPDLLHPPVFCKLLMFECDDVKDLSFL